MPNQRPSLLHQASDIPDKQPTYPWEMVMRYLRMAVDYAEETGNLTKVREWINEAERTYQADMEFKEKTNV